ncbi:hypothetical protein N0V93_008232 [Gnomoniopsis smithogilvyi]|uniref:DUF218 domain-containing protein n=1 Tax=Gnomoniopsis smithogilvyi TaxID=1191159 RepID=A0A9W8YLB9_9PEZI|nr:hypothetical protein N0V93_008232 [Gnomoniopsis smithogilvyi]
MADLLPSQAQVSNDAELVYNYHRMGMPIPATSADAIFCLCSLDLRVTKRAAELFLDGRGRWLIFSGGSGKITADLPLFREDSEAVVFARVAREMGVPSERIIIEPHSTNTGENVRFTHALLREQGLLLGHGESQEDSIRSFVLVQKPYMERRTYATFMKQWPGIKSGEGKTQFEFIVTSPQLDFAEYPDEHNPRELVINLMVGDLVRIRDYPAKGYQISQEIPDGVWEAGQRLISAGFTQHL